MKNDSLVNDEMEEYRLAAQIYVARSFTATSLTSNGVDLNKISLNPQFSQRWISIMKQGDCDF